MMDANDKECKEILGRQEIEIRQLLVKAIETSNLLKDGKIILGFNKLNGIIQKLNLLHSYIKLIIEESNENEKDSN